MAGTRTIAEIDADIQAVKAELADVHGDETEVYARIVGYYRAVQNWNKGKLDEFHQRRLFDVSTIAAPQAVAAQEAAGTSESESALAGAGLEPAALQVTAPAIAPSDAAELPDAIARYELFTRPGCPHCPPVHDYMALSAVPGTEINVDQKEGLDLAAERGVFATPTVIFYNAAGEETVRAHNAEELDAVFSSGSKAIA